MKKIGLWSLALAGLVMMSACSRTVPDGPNPGNINPGIGISEVKLFDTKEKVEENLGKPESESPNPFNAKNVIVQYPDKGLEISYLNGAVGSIVLYSSGEKDGVNWKAYEGSTEEGIWPQSNVYTIKKKLGAPIKELPKAVVYTGLWIRLDDKGDVESFSISKDEAAQLQ